ncbi:hypothetical protein CALCODRAFT_492010 [Calocera cornea HHB12733]|uniref:Uncharacterized protein n=1 Tax=Calocera cornea HHB12733 TaxID=1353952 RepID=A0A165IM06_9BASI|nr:hypothetical protein CALCODRAFT_492010 [Calocera cornea HHB12733]
MLCPRFSYKKASSSHDISSQQALKDFDAQSCPTSNTRISHATQMFSHTLRSVAKPVIGSRESCEMFTMFLNIARSLLGLNGSGIIPWDEKASKLLPRFDAATFLSPALSEKGGMLSNEVPLVVDKPAVGERARTVTVLAQLEWPDIPPSELLPGHEFLLIL